MHPALRAAVAPADSILVPASLRGHSNSSKLKLKRRLASVLCGSGMVSNNSTTQCTSGLELLQQAAPHPMWQHVLEVYDKAQQSGAATKTDTSVLVVEDGGISFVLRVASALKAKPKGLSGSRCVWYCVSVSQWAGEC